MSRRKMIGAHAPKQTPAYGKHKCRQADTRAAIRAAYNTWTERPDRSHLRRNLDYRTL